MKIAVVGATGLVGTEILKVLAGSGLKNEEILAVASEKSKGINLIALSDNITLYGTPNGDEIAEAFNIALGQQFFK